MLKDISSSKLYFEEEIVKLIVCNKYVFLKFSAMNYFKCSLWSSFVEVQCHHPYKKSTKKPSFQDIKSKGKFEKQSCIKCEKVLMPNITRMALYKEKFKAMTL